MAIELDTKSKLCCLFHGPNPPTHQQIESRFADEAMLHRGLLIHSRPPLHRYSQHFWLADKMSDTQLQCCRHSCSHMPVVTIALYYVRKRAD